MVEWTGAKIRVEKDTTPSFWAMLGFTGVDFNEYLNPRGRQSMGCSPGTFSNSDRHTKTGGLLIWGGGEWYTSPIAVLKRAV